MPDAGTGTESDDTRTEENQPQSESDESGESDKSQSLVFGAFRRAFTDTDSRLLRSYVVVSALFGGLVGVLLALALPVWILNTAGGSELATFSRTFLIVGGVLLLVVLVAPVVSAGRRHAREAGSADAGEDASADAGASAGTDAGASAGTDAGASAGTDAGADATSRGTASERARAVERATANARADALLALSGYLFVLSLYVALLISAPPDQREAPPALLAPAVEFLYSLAPVYAVAPPLLAAALIGVVHLLTR